MRILIIVFSSISFIMLSAHFFRIGSIELALLCFLLPLIFSMRKRWGYVVLSFFLLWGAYIWIKTTADILIYRISSGEEYLLLVMIMAFVIFFTLISSFLLMKKFDLPEDPVSPVFVPSVFSFFITFFSLTAAKIKISYPVLLMERFIPDSGYVAILIVAFYAAWLTEKFLMSDDTAKLRVRIWLFFSIVFFAQFFLGIAGFDIFLMTGKLHVPVPAVIVGGPVFRGEGFFMPVILVSTIILFGPAWCSYLCYFGAWDGLASSRCRKSNVDISKVAPFRYAILFLVIISAAAMRYAGVEPLIAAAAGIIFGLVGIGIMIFVSRKKGVMLHCTAYCPIGLIVDYAAKISPFRIKITENCNRCGACSNACRYGALSSSDLKRGKPGLTCTLCGDCLSSCKKGEISYSFFNLSGKNSRIVFTVIVVSLHAVFLGLAMV